jgi:uncharacterized repeat protein (TIGR03803 family)
VFEKFTPMAVLAAGTLLSAPCAHAATFQTIYSFRGGTGGAGPYGRMVFNATTGMLYGTTVSGGAGGGTVFQFDPATQVLTILYSFALGGLTGSNPQTALILGKKGVLFGVTTAGGGSANCSYGCGTIFKLDPATQILTTLYSFTGQADGGAPEGRPVFDAARSTLYGTTVRGGDFVDCTTYGCGTIYKLVLAGNVYSTLHDFRSTPDDGESSTSGMLPDSAGVLYGTASAGGPHGSGIVFRLDPASNNYAVLHGFDYHVDGNGPESDLLLKNGLLYGVTDSGGPTSVAYGTIFSMDPGTGATTTLYSFQDGNDGIFPSGGLVVGPKGSLYGTAEQGAPAGAGALFALKLKNNKFSALYDFTDGTDGALPQTGLVAGAGGVLYGVTSYGNGTIFSIKP